MEIKTNKTVKYLNIIYFVDDENRYALAPWVLRAARYSYEFLEKRGKIFPPPIQNNLGLEINEDIINLIPSPKRSFFERFRGVARAIGIVG